MRVMIIDDEAPVLRLTKHVLEAFEDVEVIGEYTNSVEALEAIRTEQPDVCFIDVEMPDLNGFEVIRSMSGCEVQFVFVTAYDQYAVEAFRVDAADYLLKPISKMEVERVLNKLRPRLNTSSKATKQQPLKLEYLGEFEVAHKGQLLEWPTEKVADFFAYLVYHAGKKVDKWELCDIFWPNISPTKAMNNVYNAMYLLKKVLNNHQIDYALTNKRGFYEFTLGQAQVDISVFEQLLKKDNQSIEALVQMEALYQGEFLARKGYDWCLPIRGYYEQAYKKCVKELLNYYSINALDEKVLTLGSKVLKLYPEEEYIALLIMPIQYQSSKATLQKFYNEYSVHFMKELNIPLSLNTKQMYTQLISS